MTETDAQTLILICRQHLDRCCAEPLAEHLALELAGIALDTALSERTRADARALLDEAQS